MSDDNSRETSSTPSRHSAASGLALLLSIAALGVSGYLWYLMTVQHAALFKQPVAQEVQNLRAELTQLKLKSDAEAKELGALAERQKVLADATRRSYDALSKDRSQWALSEIEQLLIIANQRLQLAQDFETATIALKAADSRLRALADPAMTPVRKRLATEINQVESFERADISGLAIRLATLVDSVEKLPLSLEISLTPTRVEDGKAAGAESKKEPAKTRGFFAELWRDILGLVRIRNNTESYKPLLAPEQQYFLRENLRLLLLGAQQALLRNEMQTFTHNLRSAQRWVNRYFDTHSQAIRHLNTELEVLLKTRPAGRTPDISQSLAMLRKISRESDKS